MSDVAEVVCDGIYRFLVTLRTTEDGSGHGLMLTALTLSVTRLTTVQTFATWQSEAHQGCSTFGSQVVPTAPGNFIGRLTYLMGSFNPGQSKTVSVLYRRF
jgi:hypothetical protein